MIRINKIQNIQVLCPEEESELVLDTRSVFEDLTISFLDDLSKALLKSTNAKMFPDVISLAFWLRRANLMKLKQNFFKTYGNRIILPKGIAFHIAPSNVDTIFMYSMALSMLAGNASIVRISQKDSQRTLIIISEMNKLLQCEQYIQLRNNMLIVSFGHNDEIIEKFSRVSDLRVIWGGNNTVNHIKKIPSKARCMDIPFADRYSFAVLDAEAISDCEDIKSVGSKFYNDCYTFDQNACSSPRVVFWLGDEIMVQKAKSIFWPEVEKLAEQKYQLHPANAVDKLMAVCSLAIEKENSLRASANTNKLIRVEVKEADKALRDIRCAAGFFIEYRINELKELTDFITEEDQTMSVYGIDREALKLFILNNKLRGIDRIVEVGKALDFSEIWDGMDLLKEFTREIDLQ